MNTTNFSKYLSPSHHTCMNNSDTLGFSLNWLMKPNDIHRSLKDNIAYGKSKLIQYIEEEEQTSIVSFC